MQSTGSWAPARSDSLWFHADFLARRALRAGLPEVRALCHSLACCHLRVGHTRAAAEALSQLVSLDRQRDGRDHAAVAAGLLDLGCLLQALGLWKAATVTLDCTLCRRSLWHRQSPIAD